MLFMYDEVKLADHALFYKPASQSPLESACCCRKSLILIRAVLYCQEIDYLHSPFCI